MRDMTDAWQEGMEVAVIRGGAYRSISIQRVAKVTKLHVILDDGSKYRIKTRHRAGGDYYPSRIEPATNEHKLRVEKIKLVSRCEYRPGWSDLRLEALREVVKILDSPESWETERQ